MLAAAFNAQIWSSSHRAATLSSLMNRALVHSSLALCCRRGTRRRVPMASPGESKVDENEVTSEPHHRHHRQREPTHGGDDRGRDLDLAFPLIRQSSIYSLTLDEIQNTVCEPGKSFGSMNMDEFLNNIWSVEEAGFGAAPDSTAPRTAPPNGTRGSPPLQRQGSLTVPLPLCRKTVDEVWAEIHHEQEVLHSLGRAHHGGGGNAHRQPTFGEMTLEDFLIKAGVVREGLGPASPRPPPSSTVPMQFEVPTTSYPIATGAEGAGFGHVVGPAGYEYHAHHRPAASEGHLKRYGNGYAMQQVPVGSPVSPVSSDGLAGGQADNSGYAGGGGGGGGLEGNGAVKINGGRKRAGDGPVEKVVERRQRRMIKNRESAARSRARKQAYTVELETELNMLKEENSRLREEERRARALRKQMIVECMAEHAQANAEKAAHSLRRCNSGPP